MKLAIRAIGLVLVMVAVASAGIVDVALPWKTFSEAAKSSLGGGGLGMCPGGEIYIAKLEHGKDGYAYLYAPGSDRVMFLVYVGNVDGAMPDAIGVGVLDPQKSDEIPLLKWYTLDEGKQLWASPCDYLYSPAA